MFSCGSIYTNLIGKFEEKTVGDKGIISTQKTIHTFIS